MKRPSTALRHAVMSGVLFATLLSALQPKISAASITLESSSTVTFLDQGSSTTDFSSPFTAANFTAAQTGPAAFVLSSTPSYFSASSIPGAQWIGTNATAGANVGDTALFAVSFVLPSTVSSASLSLTYGVDNDLGDTNAGIYINGTALPNSTGIPCGVGSACFGAFTPTPNTYADGSIASLLNSGTNWVYFDAVNLGGPGALIFSANITYTVGNATPEPSTLIFIALGILATVCCKLRSSRSSA